MPVKKSTKTSCLIHICLISAALITSDTAEGNVCVAAMIQKVVAEFDETQACLRTWKNSDFQKSFQEEQ